MELLILVLIQAAEIEAVEKALVERHAPLLYEAESARLSIDDLRQELKKKDLPEVLEGEDLKAWRFRLEHDLLPRCERIRVLRPTDAAFAAWTKALPERPSPFPAALLAEARDAFTAARKQHAALLAKDAAAALRWTERQIRELYEPLVKLNAQGLSAVRGYTRLNPDDADQVRWKVWAERSFLPRNEETRRTVAAGFALVDGEAPPEPFLVFLEHQISWAQRHLRWQKEGGDYAWGSRTNWPVDFSKDVEAAYQALLDRRARLVTGGK